MKLEHVLEAVLGERELDPETQSQYRRAYQRFSRHVGHSPTLKDLNYKNVNGWIATIKGSGPTRRNYRRALLILWNYAVFRGWKEPYAKQRLLQPSGERSIPSAWSLEQIETLLKSAAELPGQLRAGITSADFMRAWILLGYETALRPKDMRLLKWDSIDFDSRSLTIIQHKTGQPHCATFSVPTINALQAIKLPERELVFPVGKSGLRQWELKLYSIAKEKYGFTRRRRNGIGTLRKSHATEVYLAHGLSAAAESLGHVGGVRTALAHYIDGRAVRLGKLPPPVQAALEPFRGGEDYDGQEHSGCNTG